MYLLPSLRRLALPLVAVVLALAPTTATAQELEWVASASYAFTGNEGNVYEGVLDDGLAMPGGRFTATFVTEISAGGIDGSNVIQFGGPHILELAFHYDFTDTGGAGVFVVIGGTGRFANATGSGVTWFEDNGDGTGTVIFAGTLSR
jgi:hypothetical protein